MHSTNNTEATKAKAFGGIKWTSLSTITTSIIQLAQMSLLAHLLHPEDFGLMAMTIVILGFAHCFADMGLSNAIIFKQEISGKALSSLYWATIISGIVVFLVVLGSAYPASVFFNEPRIGALLRWSAPVFLIISFGQPFQALLQKELRFKVIALAEIIGAASGFTLALVLAVNHVGVYALIAGHVSQAVIRSILVAFFEAKYWRPSLYINLQEIKELLIFGAYQMGERSLNFLKTNVDKLLMGRLLGAGSLGFYTVPFQLMVRPVLLLNSIVTRVAFPLLSRVQNDDEKTGRGYLEMIELVSFYSMPLYMGLFVSAEPLISLYLGPGWEPSIPVFKVIVFLGIFIALGNPIGSLVLARGRADMGFWLNVYAFVLNALAVIIGSYWGLLGVCWAILLCMIFLLFPVNFWITKRVANIQPIKLMMAILPSLILSLIMLSALLVIRLYLPQQSLIRITMLTLSGTGIYTLLNVIFRKKYIKKTIQVLRS
ncbi:MAG: MOP flippase family protein [Fibrobacteria bacterium]|nr:MOP flippase family protein [Fibrobacteria bacterium]